MILYNLTLIFLYAIAAMEIAGENGNLPSCVADWPHCCDFLGWSAMLLEPQNRRKTAHFIAGRAYAVCEVMRVKAPPHGAMLYESHNRK